MTKLGLVKGFVFLFKMMLYEKYHHLLRWHQQRFWR
mgnify:CR=1 FL=1